MKTLRTMLLLCCALILAGCATPDRRAKLAQPPQYAIDDCDVNEDGICNAGDILTIRQGVNWNLRANPGWKCVFEDQVEPDPIVTPGPRPGLPPKRRVTEPIRVVSGGLYENLLVDLTNHPNPEAAGFYAKGKTDDVTIRNCHVLRGKYGVMMTFDHYPADHNGWLIEDNIFEKQFNKGIVLCGSNMTVRHNHVFDCQSHVLRAFYLANSLVEWNILGPATTAKGSCCKIHCSPKTGQTASENIEFYNNVLHMEHAGWASTWGTEDAADPDITRNCKLIGNTLLAHENLMIGFYLQGPNMEFKDNHGVNMPDRPATQTQAALVSVGKWCPCGPDPTNCTIESCTVDNGVVAGKVWPDTVIKP